MIPIRNCRCNLMPMRWNPFIVTVPSSSSPPETKHSCFFAASYLIPLFPYTLYHHPLSPNLVRFSLCISYGTELNTSNGQFVSGITGAGNGGVIFWPTLINAAIPGSSICHVDGTVVPKAG